MWFETNKKEANLWRIRYEHADGRNNCASRINRKSSQNQSICQLASFATWVRDIFFVRLSRAFIPAAARSFANCWTTSFNWRCTLPAFIYKTLTWNTQFDEPCVAFATNGQLIKCNCNCNCKRMNSAFKSSHYSFTYYRSFCVVDKSYAILFGLLLVSLATIANGNGSWCTQFKETNHLRGETWSDKNNDEKVAGLLFSCELVRDWLSWKKAEEKKNEEKTKKIYAFPSWIDEKLYTDAMSIEITEQKQI